MSKVLGRAPKFDLCKKYTLIFSYEVFTFPFVCGKHFFRFRTA